MKRQMKSSEGRHQAIEYAPRLAELTLQYSRLNSREARVAFIDTWLRTWAYDFEKTWPVIYQALEWVEQEELYKDPRAMNPDEIYPDFKSFFEARLKRPFTMWMELEQTHHYVSKYAPDLIDKTWGEVQRALGKQGEFGRSRPKDRGSSTTPIGRGAGYIEARLERDGHAELATKVRSREMSAQAAAIQVGYRKELTPLDQLRRWWKKASVDQRAAFLDEI